MYAHRRAWWLPIATAESCQGELSSGKACRAALYHRPTCGTSRTSAGCHHPKQVVTTPGHRLLMVHGAGADRGLDNSRFPWPEAAPRQQQPCLDGRSLTCVSKAVWPMQLMRWVSRPSRGLCSRQEASPIWLVASHTCSPAATQCPAASQRGGSVGHTACCQPPSASSHVEQVGQRFRIWAG